MKIPLGVQILGARLGTYFADLNNFPSVTSQMVTFKDDSPVAKYAAIHEITTATRTLRWTEDPWNGKLDVIKHPTFLQQAIKFHPAYAGDCDDYAAYWCAALTKNKLALEVWFASGMWVKTDKSGLTGHAICVYRTAEGWFWVSNWNGCTPYAIPSRVAWVQDMERVSNKKLITALMAPATIDRNDTIFFGPHHVVRR